LRRDPKRSPLVDYMGITEQSSFLRINTYFQTSNRFNVVWYFNGQKLLDLENPANTNTNNNNNNDNQGQSKFTSHCIQTNLFDHDCYLFIDYYNSKDTGYYEAVVTLKNHPKISLNMSAAVIMPSKIYFLILKLKILFFLEPFYFNWSVFV
jgi:hypothetical protein